MHVRPLAPVGAEVTGIDLAADPDTATLAALLDAFARHKLLCFRDQRLAPEDQVRFATHFGEPDVYPFRPALEGHPHVVSIVRAPGDATNFGGAWHTDGSWQARPPKATVLLAQEVPDEGGDTLFADAGAAWRDLSPGMRTTLAGLQGIYTPSLIHGRDAAHAAVAGRAGGDVAAEAKSPLSEIEVEHPLVRTDPGSGEQSLYCSPVHTHRIKDWTRAESLPLIDFLMAHATRERYLTRIQWRVGTLVVWDNRRLFHKALDDYPDQRRCMHRVLVRGDTPR